VEGIVKTWFYDKGFGFIDVKQHRKDVFCHFF
jgi:cold shock CspA family protein